MNNFMTNQTHPLIPRFPNYVLNSKIVSIHSEDRDTRSWPNANDFEVRLPQELRNVQSIRLLDINLPIDNTDVDCSSNKSRVYMELEKYNTIDELEPEPKETNASYTKARPWGGRVNSSFAVIPTSVEETSNHFCDDFSNLSYYQPPIERISKIHVKFRYHNGKLIELKKCENSNDDDKRQELNFRIEFNTLINKQGVNMNVNIPPGNFS